jgi:hypothetical protein
MVGMILRSYFLVASTIRTELIMTNFPFGHTFDCKVFIFVDGSLVLLNLILSFVPLGLP